MADSDQYRSVAAGAAAWVLRNRARARDDSIYAGVGGVALFLLQAADALKDEQYRDAAATCADELAAGVDAESAMGLYVGLAGTAFVLDECGRALGTDRWAPAVRRALDALDKGAEPASRGRTWSTVTDIVSGTAGTGLALLSLHHRMDDEQALSLAVAAADALASVGDEAQGGRSWAVDPSFPRRMPNFSHGTAGIAYFLAEAGRTAGRQDLIDVALEGAGHVTAIARKEGDTCLVPHHTPDGDDLFYLGWCHGPVGTGRLFEALFGATGDTEWRTWLERCARGLVSSGIPEQRPDGFWENVGQCCGNSGVAEFCLDARSRTSLAQELDGLARRLADDAVARASQDGDGTYWAHAEHRARPEEITSQAGLMHGAAGVGSMLLRYAAHLDGEADPPRLRLPDNPF